MPKNKKQLKRMVKFVGQLKENRFPNTKSFVQDLHDDEMFKNDNATCTTKTIQRDIKALIEEFNAPIKYDYERRGYYLLDHGWNFPCPFFTEHELLASVMGARLAEEIFPPPLRDWVRNAVDGQLASNNPDFLDTAYVRSLKVFSGLKVKIDPEVFMKVFDGWVKHHAVEIKYLDPQNRLTERLIDPHSLVFNDRAWFIKAFCHIRNDKRTFAIHRITAAEETELTFEPDQAIIDSIDRGKLFSYQEVKNVKLHCHANIVHFVQEKPFHHDQKVNLKKDGSADVIIPEIIEHEIIQWVLFEMGNAKVISPKSLATKVAKYAREIASQHLQ